DEDLQAGIERLPANVEQRALTPSQLPTWSSDSRIAHCAPCISRSVRAPCTTGRGNENLMTLRSAMSNRLMSWVGCWKSAATASLRSSSLTCSKTSEVPQNTSTVTQNGPAFLERTFKTRSPSLRMPDLADLEAKGLHGVVEFHNVIECEL